MGFENSHQGHGSVKMATREQYDYHGARGHAGSNMDMDMYNGKVQYDNADSWDDAESHSNQRYPQPSNMQTSMGDAGLTAEEQLLPIHRMASSSFDSVSVDPSTTSSARESWTCQRCSYTNVDKYSAKCALCGSTDEEYVVKETKKMARRSEPSNPLSPSPLPALSQSQSPHRAKRRVSPAAVKANMSSNGMERMEQPSPLVKASPQHQYQQHQQQQQQHQHPGPHNQRNQQQRQQQQLHVRNKNAAPMLNPASNGRNDMPMRSGTMDGLNGLKQPATSSRARTPTRRRVMEDAGDMPPPARSSAISAIPEDEEVQEMLPENGGKRASRTRDSMNRNHSAGLAPLAVRRIASTSEMSQDTSYHSAAGNSVATEKASNQESVTYMRSYKRKYRGKRPQINTAANAKDPPPTISAAAAAESAKPSPAKQVTNQSIRSQNMSSGSLSIGTLSTETFDDAISTKPLSSRSYQFGEYGKDDATSYPDPYEVQASNRKSAQNLSPSSQPRQQKQQQQQRQKQGQKQRIDEYQMQIAQPPNLPNVHQRQQHQQANPQHPLPPMHGKQPSQLSVQSVPHDGRPRVDSFVSQISSSSTGTDSNIETDDVMVTRRPSTNRKAAKVLSQSNLQSQPLAQPPHPYHHTTQPQPYHSQQHQQGQDTEHSLTMPAAYGQQEQHVTTLYAEPTGIEMQTIPKDPPMSPAPSVSSRSSRRSSKSQQKRKKTKKKKKRRSSSEASSQTDGRQAANSANQQQQHLQDDDEQSAQARPQRMMSQVSASSQLSPQRPSSAARQQGMHSMARPPSLQKSNSKSHHSVSTATVATSTLDMETMEFGYSGNHRLGGAANTTLPPATAGRTNLSNPNRNAGGNNNGNGSDNDNGFLKNSLLCQLVQSRPCYFWVVVIGLMIAFGIGAAIVLIVSK